MTGEKTITFDDGAAYEHLMRRWTTAAGTAFLEWIDAANGADWLDVGCGTGLFTELILQTCSPGSVLGVDPALAQLETARKIIGSRTDFRPGDAQALPLPTDSYDAVVSALVINFIPEPDRAIAEMKRVCRPGGLIAAYVWDVKGMRSPAAPLLVALRKHGYEPPPVPGGGLTTPDGLRGLFEGAALIDIATKTIDVSLTFSDFEEYWTRHTPSFLPGVKMFKTLPEDKRTEVRQTVREMLRSNPDGTVEASVSANATKARRMK